MVSVIPEYAIITAPDASPDVPVVTPDQDGEQLSELVPSAIRENTYVVPPDALPDAFGNPETKFHPDGVDTVAVFDRHCVTHNSRSPTDLPAGAVQASVDGLATLLAQKTPVPIAWKVGVAIPC